MQFYYLRYLHERSSTCYEKCCSKLCLGVALQRHIKIFQNYVQHRLSCMICYSMGWQRFSCRHGIAEKNHLFNDSIKLCEKTTKTLFGQWWLTPRWKNDGLVSDPVRLHFAFDSIKCWRISKRCKAYAMEGSVSDLADASSWASYWNSENERSRWFAWRGCCSNIDQNYCLCLPFIDTRSAWKVAKLVFQSIARNMAIGSICRRRCGAIGNSTAWREEILNLFPLDLAITTRSWSVRSAFTIKAWY